MAGVDIVVGLGGGSSLDIAKLVAKRLEPRIVDRRSLADSDRPVRFWRSLLGRGLLLRRGPETLERALRVMAPLSMTALLATLVLLFGFQGEQILAQPLIIALLAVPILIQVYFNAGLAYWLNRATGEAHCVAAPSALIGASNFFELAVAAAISLFGFESGAALATVVGVLIEVPVMLTVVAIVNRSRGWYDRGPAVRRLGNQRDDTADQAAS